jgi:hypothetical protein
VTRIIIRAVPERKEFIDYLRRNLPNAEWCVDDGPNRNAYDNFMRALAMAGDDPCVHMEEDVILTKDFWSKISQIISSNPDRVTQFFSMRSADLTTGSRWDNNFISTLCFYMPGMNGEIMSYGKSWAGKAKDPTGFDLMVRDYLKSKKLRYWINIPSLVEHRIAKSVIDPRRSSKRQSRTFAEPML